MTAKNHPAKEKAMGPFGSESSEDLTISPVPRTRARQFGDSPNTKCFERLILSHIKTVITADLDQNHFAYRANRSTKDAVIKALHTALTHVDEGNTSARMLFVDFSSAFNTVIPHKLVQKLSSLGLVSSLCTWILDFLRNRPQNVRMGGHTSSTLILNTGTPQGCVLSPLLYSFFTKDCRIPKTCHSYSFEWGKIRIRIRIRKSFIAKCVCTHKEFVLVLGASSTESTNIVQTTYN